LLRRCVPVEEFAIRQSLFPSLHEFQSELPFIACHEIQFGEPETNDGG
jgi:hypothetical protein